MRDGYGEGHVQEGNEGSVVLLGIKEEVGKGEEGRGEMKSKLKGVITEGKIGRLEEEGVMSEDQEEGRKGEEGKTRRERGGREWKGRDMEGEAKR